MRVFNQFIYNVLAAKSTRSHTNGAAFTQSLAEIGSQFGVLL